MATARRNIIVEENSLVHITWRCLNREFFLKSNEIKDFVLNTWRRFKNRYGVKIYEFVIMDNHIHLLAKVENAKKMGDFMRVSNSQIALFINKKLHRDSHALRERYESPVIQQESYLVNTMGYIWFNRFRVTQEEPESYKYCSLFYRMNGLTLKLLDNYEDLPVSGEAIKNPQKFVRDLLNAFKSRLFLFASEVFEHKHTIGSFEEIEVRKKNIKLKLSSRHPP